MGRNRTVTVQLAPAPKVLPQVVDTKLNPAPLTEAELGTVSVMAPAPVFVKVVDKSVALSAARFPKVSADNAALCAAPVPFNANEALTSATPAVAVTLPG